MHRVHCRGSLCKAGLWHMCTFSERGEFMVGSPRMVVEPPGIKDHCCVQDYVVMKCQGMHPDGQSSGQGWGLCKLRSAMSLQTSFSSFWCKSNCLLGKAGGSSGSPEGWGWRDETPPVSPLWVLFPHQPVAPGFGW